MDYLFKNNYCSSSPSIYLDNFPYNLFYIFYLLIIFISFYSLDSLSYSFYMFSNPSYYYIIYFISFLLLINILFSFVIAKLIEFLCFLRFSYFYSISIYYYEGISYIIWEIDYEWILYVFVYIGDIGDLIAVLSSYSLLCYY